MRPVLPDASCTAAASSSLPVPVSPRRQMATGDRATAARSDNSRCSAGTQVEMPRRPGISTSWFQRADARPNFGDYNSSELLNFDTFVETWGDGRFPGGTFVPPTCTPAPPSGQPCPPRLAGTPDTMFAVVKDRSD